MSTDAILNQSEPNLILTAHATKVNQTEPNRKRVWPVKITPYIIPYMYIGNHVRAFSTWRTQTGSSKISLCSLSRVKIVLQFAHVIIRQISKSTINIR